MNLGVSLVDRVEVGLDIQDVRVMLQIMEGIGASVRPDKAP